MSDEKTRQGLTRWSDSHVLLAIHHKASHGLTIWVVGSSLTYCRRAWWGNVGETNSGQLVLLIKFKSQEKHHLLTHMQTLAFHTVSLGFMRDKTLDRTCPMKLKYWEQKAKPIFCNTGNIFRQPKKIKENQSYPPPPHTHTHTQANWDVLTVSSRFSKCVCMCVLGGYLVKNNSSTSMNAFELYWVPNATLPPEPYYR